MNESCKGTQSSTGNGKEPVNESWRLNQSCTANKVDWWMKEEQLMKVEDRDKVEQ